MLLLGRSALLPSAVLVLLLCTAPAACAAAASDVHGGHDIFSGTRVAVLLTGQAFRTPKARSTDQSSTCAVASYEAQRMASQSVLTQVILPLEARGSLVEVLYTFPPCGRSAAGATMLKSLETWYSPRVVARRIVRSRHVGHSWQLAYMLLRDHMAVQPHGRVSGYDFVFSVRHDILLLQNLNAWVGDLSLQNFVGEVTVDCEYGDRRTCRTKANDKMLWVPRAQLPAVMRLVAHDDLPGDRHFNPHYLVESFLRVPQGTLAKSHHGLSLTNASAACASGSEGARRVPPHLLARFVERVGQISVCDGTPFYRFAPDRGWTRL